MERVRILLVTPPPAISRAFRARLSLEPDFAIVGEANDELEAVELVRALAVDVAVLDLEMPEGRPRPAYRAIRACCPGVGFVLLTLRADPEARAWAEHDEGVRLVSKHGGAEALVAGVRAVAHR